MLYTLPATTEVDVGSDPVEMQGYGDALKAAFVGFACVRRTMMNGVTEYWPLILPKVKFAIPSTEMQTQEEQIEWQTEELTATIFRDDTAAANWKYISAEGMATEAEAVAAYKAFLQQGA